MLNQQTANETYGFKFESIYQILLNFTQSCFKNSFEDYEEELKDHIDENASSFLQPKYYWQLMTGAFLKVVSLTQSEDMKDINEEIINVYENHLINRINNIDTLTNHETQVEQRNIMKSYQTNKRTKYYLNNFDSLGKRLSMKKQTFLYFSSISNYCNLWLNTKREQKIYFSGQINLNKKYWKHKMVEVQSLPELFSELQLIPVSKINLCSPY